MGDRILEKGDALIIVDMQKDFLPGGPLAVPGADAIVPRINGYIERFTRAGLPVFATRDWHPPDHCSFTAQGGPWPDHCVAGSAGAEFADGLDFPAGIRIVSKATRPDRDAYSGFEDTDLADSLVALSVARVFVCGVATEYCVLETALDAVERGFETFLLEDAIAAIDAEPGAGDRAIEILRSRGVPPITVKDFAR